MSAEICVGERAFTSEWKRKFNFPVIIFKFHYLGSSQWRLQGDNISWSQKHTNKKEMEILTYGLEFPQKDKLVTRGTTFIIQIAIKCFIYDRVYVSLQVCVYEREREPEKSVRVVPVEFLECYATGIWV